MQKAPHDAKIFEELAGKTDENGSPIMIMRLAAAPQDEDSDPTLSNIVASFQEAYENDVMGEQHTNVTMEDSAGEPMKKTIPREFTEATADEVVVFDNLYIPPEIATKKLVKKIDNTVSQVLETLAPYVKITEIEESGDITHLLDAFLKRAEGTSFYLINLSTLVAKYREWECLMPRIKPFYAMKCNPLEGICRALQVCGAGFDCASKPEMEIALKIGVPANRIIFANPCKMTAHIEYARDHGVDMMTFDNLEELVKIQKYHPKGKAVLRLLPPDSSSAVCQFGSKFGANKAKAKKLLKLAMEMGVECIGTSFHVGSGCFDVRAYELALRLAREVFDIAEKYGHKMTLLDIGGGFPGADDGSSITFVQIASVVRPLIDELFPPHVEVIAEPGRYFATQCITLAVNVIAKRGHLRDVHDVTDLENGPMSPNAIEKVPEPIAEAEDEEDEDDTGNDILYYLSDGVYGSFNNLFFDHAHAHPRVLHPRVTPDGGEVPTRSSTLFGPTCDSIDVICRNVSLPDLEVGDWLYFIDMGAYTAAAATAFNGFTPPPPIYIVTYSYDNIEVMGTENGSVISGRE